MLLYGCPEGPNLFIYFTCSLNHKTIKAFPSFSCFSDQSVGLFHPPSFIQTENMLLALLKTNVTLTILPSLSRLDAYQVILFPRQPCVHATSCLLQLKVTTRRRPKVEKRRKGDEIKVKP